MAIISPLTDIEHLREALLRHRGCRIAATNRAAVVLIVHPIPTDLELLIIRRAVRDGDPWSGHMGLPGGHRHAKDADDLHTALRETQEEIGVDLKGSELLGTLDDIQASASGQTIDLVISSFVYLVGASPSLEPSAEVAEAFWVSISALAGSKLRTTHEIVLNGYKKVLPGWNIQGHILWGLTYRIVTNLLAHLANSETDAGSQ